MQRVVNKKKRGKIQGCMPKCLRHVLHVLKPDCGLEGGVNASSRASMYPYPNTHKKCMEHKQANYSERSSMWLKNTYRGELSTSDLGEPTSNLPLHIRNQGAKKTSRIQYIKNYTSRNKFITVCRGCHFRNIGGPNKVTKVGRSCIN